MRYINNRAGPSGSAGAFGRSSGPIDPERRIHASVFLTGLTAEDGAWLARALPSLMRKTRPEPGAVKVEHVALRYRSGRLGVADALDATAALLEPFAAAGAQLERRNEWYIADDDDEDDDDDDDDDLNAHNFFGRARRATRLDETPEQNLLVSVRVQVDASAEDAGAATLYWAALGLAQ